MKKSSKKKQTPADTGFRELLAALLIRRLTTVAKEDEGFEVQWGVPGVACLQHPETKAILWLLVETVNPPEDPCEVLTNFLKQELEDTPHNAASV